MELTELRETAELARLNLSGEELEKNLPPFKEMLSFLDVMQAAGNDGAMSPFSEKTGDPAAFLKTADTCFLRPDTPPKENLSEAMLSQAPERDGRFIVIPNVL
jgi:aspartyl/glutamyl-tRNA(Asn/Gln) amidotransferase C subunit